MGVDSIEASDSFSRSLSGQIGSPLVEVTTFYRPSGTQQNVFSGIPYRALKRPATF